MAEFDPSIDHEVMATVMVEIATAAKNEFAAQIAREVEAFQQERRTVIAELKAEIAEHKLALMRAAMPAPAAAASVAPTTKPKAGGRA